MTLVAAAPETDFAPRIGRSVSIDHAAKLLGVSRRTVYNRISDGRLRTVRTLGGSQRVVLDSVMELRGAPARTGPRRNFRGAVRATAATMSVLALLVFGAALPAAAQGHRARVSADLADHLTAGSQNIDVIVHGTPAEVAAIAKRYNVKITKNLETGAVLHVNAGQLDALQQDPDVDHLSGDIRIQSSSDVTAESIGADQVWAGTGALQPQSGRLCASPFLAAERMCILAGSGRLSIPHVSRGNTFELALILLQDSSCN